jgi:hypothetical protein
MSPREVIVKTAVVHTVTYFAVGFAAFTLLDYPALVANTEFGANMRPLNHPLVFAGPLLQPIRGVLFGSIIYLLRASLFGSRSGWLLIWVTFAGIGILGTFAAPAGSIEGLIYTRLPLSLHLIGLPELFLQTLILSYILFQWVEHPEKRWIGRLLWAAFVVVIAIGIMAVASLGLSSI